MEKEKKAACLTFGVLLAFGAASFGAEPAGKKGVPSAFERLKTLAGEWEGVSTEKTKESPAAARYEITSAGTAVVERLFVGTPHEMVSVYYANGDEVGMTHYCALGNQPQMKLTSASGKSLRFEMKAPAGVKSMEEPHMHGLKLTFLDEGGVKQEWMYYEGGKPGPSPTVVTLTRKK